MRNFLATACAAISLLATPARSAGFFDHSALNDILARTVDDEGRVDMKALKEDHQSALESYLIRLADVDLAGWPRPEKLAFWINAYNARVLLMVLEHPEIQKMSQGFALLAKPFPVAGRKLSPYDIQYRILLNRTNPDNQERPIPFVSLDPPEPRAHFALVAGAMGSPRLRRFAYTAENVDRTLSQNATVFINSEKAARLEKGRLWVSLVLKNAAKDFESKGGLVPFLVKRLDEEKRPDAAALAEALQTGFKKAEYSFDWTVYRLIPPTAEPIETPTAPPTE